MEYTGSLLLFLYSSSLVTGTFLEDGKEYVYDMDLYQNTGTMDHQPAAAALAYQLRLRMQVSGNTINVRTMSPKYSRYVGDWDKWVWDTNTFLDGDSLGDFSIEYNNGLVSSISVPRSSSLHTRNAIKSVAAAWQIKLEEGPFYIAEEKLLHGSCRVQYSVVEGLVAKAVSHMKDCTQRPHRMVDNFRGWRCDGQMNMEGRTSPEPLYSNTNTKYFVEKRGNKYQVNKLISEGGVVAQFFESDGVSHFVHVNRSLTLVETKSSDGSIQPRDTLTLTDLAFEWESGHYKWNDQRDLRAAEPYFDSWNPEAESQGSLKSLALSTLDEIFSNLDRHGHDRETVDRLHKFGAGAVMPLLYRLNTDSIDQVFNTLKGDSSERGVSKQNLFLFFLTDTGTTAAAMWFKEAITRKILDNPTEIGRVVTAVPFSIRRPNAQLVSEYASLIESNPDLFDEMVGPLAIAHLVRRTCELAGSYTDRQQCERELSDKWADTFYQKFVASSDVNLKHLMISAMENLFSKKVTELLGPAARGELQGVDDRLQRKCVKAALMGTYYTGNTVHFMLPIFLNMRNGHETRIQAIESIFTLMDVDVTTLSTIMTQMYRETDLEVMNYVYTLFDKHALGQVSCFSEKKMDRMRYFLKFLKQMHLHQTSYGPGASRTFRQSFKQEKYGYGGGFEYWILGSHQVSAPLEVRFRIDTTLFDGYRDHQWEFWMRLEGLPRALVDKFNTMGQEWRLEDLQAILTSMGVMIQPAIPVRVELGMAVKGVIVAQNMFYAEDAEEGGKLREFMQSLQGFTGNVYAINRQSSMSAGSVIYEQPIDSGLPMTYVAADTSMASIVAKIKRGLRKGVIFREIDFDVHFLTQSTSAVAFFHPQSGVSYGIVQDRIFNTHIPRQLVIGVNVAKKELKLTVSEPEVASPIDILMNSRTSVNIWQTSLHDTMDITPSCPTCGSNKHFISRGESAKKNQIILDTSAQSLGSVLRSEYFDCESDLDRGRTLQRVIGAFMPQNKHPLTTWSLITLGFQQLRTYFIYFPRAEQCGLYASYSQSPTHPVKDVEISVQVKGKDTDDTKFGYSGRSTMIKIKVKAKGPDRAGEDRSMKLYIQHVTSVGARKNAFKVQLGFDPNPRINMDAYTICMSMNDLYSNHDTFESEFLPHQLRTPLQVSGTADFRYGEGQSCGAAQGSTKMTYLNTNTELSMDELTTKPSYLKCMEQKNSPEWNQRQGSPYTAECFETEADAARARKYTLNMDFEYVTPTVREILDSVWTVAQAVVLPFEAENPIAMHGALSDRPIFNFTFVYKEGDTAVDTTITTSKGTTRYPNLAPALPEYTTKSLTQLRLDESVSRMIESGLLSWCTQSSASVSTLDDVLYPSSPSSCWSLVSAHCSPSPTYAVFSKAGGSLPLAMKVYIGGHMFEFTPSGSSVRITREGGQQIRVGDQEGVEIKEGDTALFHLSKWGPVYTLNSAWKVMIIYDGTFIEVIPAPWVKGQHCGLCGNYDGDKDSDLLSKTGAPVTGEQMNAAWCQ